MKRGLQDPGLPTAVKTGVSSLRPDRAAKQASARQPPEREASSPDALLLRADQLGHRLSRFHRPRVERRRAATAKSDLLQRVVAQIELKKAATKIPEKRRKKAKSEPAPELIKSLRIVGRPPRVFSSTMGDHTTAFAIHRISLEQQLAGKTFKQAFGVLQDLFAKAKLLPGYLLKASLHTTMETSDDEEDELEGTQRLPHGNRLSTAEDELSELLEVDNLESGSSAEASKLQLAVGAYLDFRELIPLSTINIRAKEPVHAGKGKGEAGQVEVLRLHQAGKRKKATERLQAIVGLFDLSSASLAAIELVPEMLAKMAPGLSADIPIVKRAQLMTKQHVQSIEMTFPDAFDHQLTTQQATTEIENTMKPHLRGWLEAVAENIDQKIATNENEIVRIPKLRQVKADRLLLKKLLQRRKPLGEKRRAVEVAYETLFGEKLELEAKAVGKTEKIKTKAKKSKRRKIRKVAQPTDTEVDPQISDVNEEEEARKSPLVLQIVLDDEGKIASIPSEGRSDSPFPLTMGAHSTAWIAHLDRVRKALIGQAVEEAPARVLELVKEALSLYKRRVKLFKVDDYQQSLIEEAWQELGKYPRKLATQRGVGQLLTLQSYLAQLLSFINFIPGSTIYATDTGGKSEGFYRNTLKDFEDGKPQIKSALRQSVYGLLDVKEVTEEQATGLRKDHLKLVKATYPKSYAAVFQRVKANLLAEPTNKKSTKKRKRY